MAPKKMCIISSNFPTSKRVGGFASMTTQLALSLKGGGWDVTVLVPRKVLGGKVVRVKGFTVRGASFSEMITPQLYREIGADIYHSQNPTIMTLFASLYEPSKKHVVTCRDPRDFHDWLAEFRYATPLRRLKTPLSYVFEEGLFTRWAIRRADIVGCPAYFLQNKIKRMYGLETTPIFIPNIERIPTQIPKKSKTPTVCFIGRLDKRKRPELVLELAKQFPHVHFDIVGRAEEDGRQRKLKQQAAELKNVTMHGLLSKFDSEKFYGIYNRSWILVNTSAREGLPLTFIEAAGRGCAILSNLNPDSFASRFGYWAKKEDFGKGLTYLLTNSQWKKKGEEGYAYVKKIYNWETAVKKHIEIYRSLLR